jgi:hypothetical protein
MGISFSLVGFPTQHFFRAFSTPPNLFISFLPDIRQQEAQPDTIRIINPKKMPIKTK